MESDRSKSEHTGVGGAPRKKSRSRTKDVTIYHNPASNTSLRVLAMIEASGAAPRVIDYLHTPPSKSRLSYLIRKMRISARDLLRKGVLAASQHGGADAKWNDDTILDLLVRSPELLLCPIVESWKGARLCRPAERVLDLLDYEKSAARDQGRVIHFQNSASSLHPASQSPYGFDQAGAILMRPR